jgi:protein-tyrosine phosphatase
MDNSNYTTVIELAENLNRNKSQTNFGWIISKWKVDVPDPILALPNGFQIVYTMLDEVCDAIKQN